MAVPAVAPRAPAAAILVAAGVSRRMEGRDKVTALLAGRPLLAWALDALAAAPSIGGIVVVVAPERVSALADEPWLRVHGDRVRVVAGGARRQESVAAGVAAAEARATVLAVHDGARPLVTPALVEAVVAAAAEHGAAIPVRPVAETVKRVAAGRVVATVDRAALVTAQTPQAVRRELLLAAYAGHDPAGVVEFTDEAALLEAAGVPVVTVPGEPDNVKVTTLPDLELAEALLERRMGPFRVGYGHDSHPFGPADGLALGGIEIPEAPRLQGHSDGDAALHAVAGALLGAAGLGDLGRLFPAGDPATGGIASARLLGEVERRLAAAGWRPLNVDLLIVGSRPRLGAARLDAMRDVIASLLGLAPGAVAVKASSGNLDGPEGRGSSVSAAAVATVRHR